MSAQPFVHLRVHSSFSLLEGALSVGKLAKLAGQYAEKARIAIRNVRRDGNEALKADENKKEISEDERKRGETEVQQLTDEMVKTVDDEQARKEADIMQT